MIAIAVGQTMAKYMDLLLDPIFACGLSDALTQALVDMAHYIPPARPTIQEKLLNLLSQVLCGRPFMPLGSPAHGGPPSNITRDPRDPNAVEQQDAEIALALQTLGSFDFSGKWNASPARSLVLTNDDRLHPQRIRQRRCDKICRG